MWQKQLEPIVHSLQDPQTTRQIQKTMEDVKALGGVVICDKPNTKLLDLNGQRALNAISFDGKLWSVQTTLHVATQLKLPLWSARS